jgi:hypothetical protein
MASFARRAILAAAVLGCCALGPRAAVADLPSYATGDETIRGTIVALTGKYALTLQDERGFEDSVTLRDGTAIGPAGLTLQPGDTVTILGHAAGTTFEADAINVDDAEGSSGYTDASGGSYYLGPYAANSYPPYVMTYGGGVYGYFPGGYYPGGFPPCCFPPGFIIVTPTQNSPGHNPGAPVVGRPVLVPHPPVLRPRGPVTTPTHQQPPSHSGGGTRSSGTSGHR